MPSLYDNAFAPQPDESLPPELKGALSQAGGPQEMRGLPIQSPVPASPLDLFVRKPFTAPEVVGGGYSAPPPIEHARMQPIQVDDSLGKMANQSLDQVTALLGKIGEKKQPSVEDLMARIRAASASQPQPTDKGAFPKESLPNVSNDRADYYKNASGFESGDNPNAVNPHYAPDKAAAGMFQFMPATVASLRMHNPELAKQLDANWRTDRRQQLLLMNAYTDISDNMIRAITEKEPSNDQRFAMHMLGHGLGAKVIKDPSATIESLVGKPQWDEMIRVNPRVLKPGMTGEEFLAWARPIFGRKHE